MQKHQPPRSDEDDEQDKPERAPSFLTARELQAREPSRSPPDAESPRDSPQQPKKKR